MRLGAGRYVFLRGGALLAAAHWDRIPEEIDELIAFEPEIPPGPHTDAEHEAIEALPEKLKEIMGRCRR